MTDQTQNDWEERALAAEKRVAELETALQPFSISGGVLLPDDPPDSTVIGVRAADLRRARAVYRHEPVPEEEEDVVTPSMLAEGWACLKRAHLPKLGAGPGLIEAYKAMRKAFRKEKP